MKVIPGSKLAIATLSRTLRVFSRLTWPAWAQLVLSPSMAAQPHVFLSGQVLLLRRSLDLRLCLGEWGSPLVVSLLLEALLGS